MEKLRMENHNEERHAEAKTKEQKPQIQKVFATQIKQVMHQEWTADMFESTIDYALHGIGVYSAIIEKEYDAQEAGKWAKLAYRTLGLLTLRVGAEPNARLVAMLERSIEETGDEFGSHPPGAYPVHQAVRSHVLSSS
jgi:hypothetical protein